MGPAAMARAPIGADEPETEELAEAPDRREADARAFGATTLRAGEPRVTAARACGILLATVQPAGLAVAGTPFRLTSPWVGPRQKPGDDPLGPLP